MLGRNASTVSREIRRSTWFPSNESELTPAVPVKTAQDGPMDRQVLHRRRPRAPIPDRPETGANPAIGRPTAWSAWDATCTPRLNGRPGSSWPGSSRDKTARENIGAQLAIFPRMPEGARISVTHDNGTELARRAPARRAGHGRLFRRPVLQLAAGRQRKRAAVLPPASVQEKRDPDGYGWGCRGMVDETDNPPIVRAGLPHARRGVRRQTC